MCRFVLYQGPPLTLASLVTEPVHAIIKQSMRAKELEDPVNGDGFGVLWYVPEISPQPAVFKSFTPAWSNLNLIELARVTRSGCILAHVRAATPGLPVSEMDCHPFTSGPYALMHNGDLAAFPLIRRTILDGLSNESFSVIRGRTDSEHLFGMFLDFVRSATAADPLEAMAASLTATIRTAVRLSREGIESARRDGAAWSGDTSSYLNMAVSDGHRSVAVRCTTAAPEHASSLYLHRGRRYICEEGLCRMIEPERGAGTVLISSEPLSEDPGWQMIEPNTMVLVREDRSVMTRPLDLAAA